jgi:hypothetical protein
MNLFCFFLPPAKKEKGNPTHIAHICKSHQPMRKPKFAKECNLSIALAAFGSIFCIFETLVFEND